MNSLAFSQYARRAPILLAAIAGIVAIVGCGSGNGNLSSLGGGFTNTSLTGQYVISQTGIGVNQQRTASDPFSETIIFTADGKGGLTATVDDFDQVGGPFGLTASVAGTYSIASDGTGSINIGGSGGSNYAITMIDDSHFYVIEQDVFATSSGFGEKQDTSAFAATPSGIFVFKAHNLDTSSRVGGITIASGVISGTEDRLSLGVLSSSAPVDTSISMTAPDATNGSGTFTLADGTSFNYYVVNSSKFYIMSNSVSGSLEIGQAEAQTGGPFSLATLAANSSYVFGSAGDTAASGAGGIHSAGVFTTDGNGNITGGAVDYVQDNTINTDLVVSGGAYTLASNGRGTTSLTLAGGTISPQIFWMVNGTRAYFLANSTAAVEDGTFTLQQGGPFTAMSSQASFVMDGFDTAFKDRVGLLKPTTTGAFNWNQAANSFDVNLGGTPTVLGTNGTYTVSSNGRVTVTVNGVTSSLVFYLSSANTGVMVQEDADIGGSFSQQASQ
jgi:hypothetical protein